MLIEVKDYNPESCDECRFCETKSVDWGRNISTLCLFTGIGDSSCENNGEINIAHKRMIKECPFKISCKN
jgi:hypothetical protein